MHVRTEVKFRPCLQGKYISVLSLIFHYSLNVPYSCKSANKLTTGACKEPISTAFSTFHVIVKYNSLLVISFVTDVLSVITYQNIRIFIKWKHSKYHAERSKYPFYPGVEIFSFQHEVIGMRISKKTHPRVNFTSPTRNMPLSYSKNR